MGNGFIAIPYMLSAGLLDQTAQRIFLEPHPDGMLSFHRYEDIDWEQPTAAVNDGREMQTEDAGAADLSTTQNSGVSFLHASIAYRRPEMCQSAACRAGPCLCGQLYGATNESKEMKRQPLSSSPCRACNVIRKVGYTASVKVDPGRGADSGMLSRIRYCMQRNLSHIPTTAGTGTNFSCDACICLYLNSPAVYAEDI
ncbi:MAG: hypothetical protein ACLRL6_08375 [Clostridium sp.]